VSDRPAGRLFVYGSLRSDAPRERQAARAAHALLAAGAVLEGKATLSGRLYAPDWYPGLVPGPGAKVHATKVRGEVWRIENPGLLAKLDEYEGEAYIREPRRVTLKDGRRVTAWTYRYVADLSGVPLIASGDYLDWVRKR
jgi:gamma-glutamylcyclotransferase (GGCT)/AIG2-like uncharacterized protein YtfP